MAFEITLEEFIMKKMEDRPPRYEDIGKDRRVPFEVGADEVRIITLYKVNGLFRYNYIIK